MRSQDWQQKRIDALRLLLDRYPNSIYNNDIRFYIGVLEYNNGNYTLIAKNPLGTANQTINGHFLKEPFPGEGGAALEWLMPPGTQGGRGVGA